MADLLDTAASFLQQQARANLSRTVVYRRASSSVSLVATLGSQVLSTRDYQGNLKIERTDLDFLVTATDLVLSNALTTPQRGDTVDVVYGTVTRRYEVTAPGNEPVWRYTDAHQQMVRVHTKYLGTV